MPQNIDILGHGGHDPQTHRSAWEIEDLEKLGYTVLERDYTMSLIKRHTDYDVDQIDPHVKLLDAIKVL